MVTQACNLNTQASLHYIKTLSQKGEEKGTHIYQLASHMTGPEPGAFSILVYMSISCIKSAVFFLLCGNLINMLGDDLTFPLKVDQMERSTGKIH